MDKAKVIVLCAVKNEEWIMGPFLSAMSHLADHVIISDQCSDDRTRSICRGFNKVILIENDSDAFNEPQRQEQLLHKARTLFPGPKLLLRFDADEIPSANLFGDAEWNALLEAPPGARVELQNVCFYGSPYEYRTNHVGTYGVSHLSYGMIDNGAPYAGPAIHAPRLPFDYSLPPIRLHNVVCMHYQFLDISRALAKQAWYMCYEWLRTPQPTALDLAKRYHWVLWDVHEWPPRISPPEWLSGWRERGVDLSDVVRAEHSWWEWEVLRLFTEHGADRFAPLPIWDFDWEQARKAGLALGIAGLPSREVPDPRTSQVRVAHHLIRLWGPGCAPDALPNERTGELTCPIPDGWAPKLDGVEIVAPTQIRIKTECKLDLLPVVSVITPVWEKSPRLEETIKHVLGQNYPRLEYIVQDHRPQGETEDLRRSFAGRLKWRNRTDTDRTRSLNQVLWASAGEVTAVVWPNVILLPDAVEIAVDRLTAQPELLGVWGDWRKIDTPGNMERRVSVPGSDIAHVMKWHPELGPVLFLRRQVVERLGGLDQRFGFLANFDLWLRAALMGPMIRIPEPLALATGAANADGSGPENVKASREHVELVKKLYSLPGLPDEVCRVKREAYSGAHYAAGLACGTARCWARKRHFLAAILYLFPFRREHRHAYSERIAVSARELVGPLYPVFRMLLRSFFVARSPKGVTPS